MVPSLSVLVDLANVQARALGELEVFVFAVVVVVAGALEGDHAFVFGGVDVCLDGRVSFFDGVGGGGCGEEEEGGCADGLETRHLFVLGRRWLGLIRGEWVVG